VRIEKLSRADRELVEDTLRVMSITFSYLDGIESLTVRDGRGSPPYSPLLYSRLGDLYVEKQRYQDAADAYRAFVARDPNNEYARAVDAGDRGLSQGRLRQLVLDGKRDYVERYNFGTAFWQGRERGEVPAGRRRAQDNLKDLARLPPLRVAEVTSGPKTTAQAARWYRLNSSPRSRTIRNRRR
jgi:tetratricopeptide (TPR) repeat protein